MHALKSDHKNQAWTLSGHSRLYLIKSTPHILMRIPPPVCHLITWCVWCVCVKGLRKNSSWLPQGSHFGSILHSWHCLLKLPPMHTHAVHLSIHLDLGLVPCLYKFHHTLFLYLWQQQNPTSLPSLGSRPHSYRDSLLHSYQSVLNSQDFLKLFILCCILYDPLQFNNNNGNLHVYEYTYMCVLMYVMVEYYMRV